jgi:hypothetical protein
MTLKPVVVHGRFHHLQQMIGVGVRGPRHKVAPAAINCFIGLIG